MLVLFHAVIISIFIFLSALYYSKYYKEREKNIQLTLLYEKERELAITDPLTGLYNRRSLKQRITEEISRAVRYKHNFITLFIDLDDFKMVNDKYGHAAGDMVLKETSDRLKRIIRRYDIAARYGGDEFVVILLEIPMEPAILLAKKIIEAIKNIEVKDVNAGISASIGIHEFASENYADNPIQEADRAMYHVKDNEKGAIYISKKNLEHK